MTENEAIKELSYDSTAYGGRCTEGVRRVAIHALSEIQVYRAIGTVEDFKALKEDKNFLEFLYNQIMPNEMEQYLSMYRMKDKVAVNGYADQCGLMPAT